jgi:hypothetical protein
MQLRLQVVSEVGLFLLLFGQLYFQVVDIADMVEVNLIELEVLLLDFEQLGPSLLSLLKQVVDFSLLFEEKGLLDLYFLL